MTLRTQATAEQAATAKLNQLDEDSLLCVSSLPHIRQLLPEPETTGPQTGTIGRHSPESSEPWQGAAAAVYWTIHYGARRLEEALRAGLNLQPLNPARGGSEANTISALLALPRLATTAPHPQLAAAAKTVSHWVRMIDQLGGLDGETLNATSDEWRPIPRHEGKPIPCPYCSTFSLRMNLKRVTARCFNPDCRDREQQPPVARMDHGWTANAARLVFRDGHVVDYRELAQIPAAAEE